ncbi:DEAD/DEAH box helicase [Allohahella marinimesophila]|uniref:DEAD/DEAH box helicase n=1 Tax=Allohahella marinimesophila TaxID=1054972 RepID=A0ABP7NT23_9GAMM
MNTTIDNFLTSFDKKTLDKGRDLFRRGKVLDVHVQDDGELQGLVQGSTREPYRQTVFVNNPATNPRGKNRVMGLCSCPVHRDCKHVTAVVFEYFAQQAEAITAEPANITPVKATEAKPSQRPTRRIEAEPQPLLRFGKGRYQAHRSGRVRTLLQQQKQLLKDAGEPVNALLESEQFCYVLPGFRYEDVTVDTLPEDIDAERVEQTLVVDGECLAIVRNVEAEQAWLDELHWVGLRPLLSAEASTTDDDLAHGLVFDLVHQDQPWIELMTKVVPRWETEGWEVRYNDDFPFANIVVPEEDVTWFNDLSPAEDGSLFLGIGIEIDGRQYELLPCLLRLMNEYTPASLAQLPEGGALPVVVEDGTKLYLPVSRIRTLISTLYELFDTQPKNSDIESGVRIQQADMALLDELEMESRHHESVVRLCRMIDQLSRPALADEVELPDSFKATLRGYQSEGVRWLQLLRRAEAGGILADDMGLGKTIQTLAHLCVEQAEGRLSRPALLVVPTSLITNWRAEAAKFAPTLRLLVLHGPDRHLDFSAIDQHDLIITTYPLVIRDAEVLMSRKWSQLILDEAQNIKNPLSKVTQLLCRFTASQRLCLTGTPLENHLGELWSQFHFLNPGLLRERTHFNRHFRKPIEQHGDARRQRALHARIAPFMLRRTKAEVATELPPKTIMIKRAVFKTKQRDLYETVRVTMEKKVRRLVASKGLKRSQIEVLDALLKLRQICCDPALLKLPAAQQINESAKLELLLTLLPELLEEGRRVLIFSQFTSMLSRIESALQTAAIDYVKLTGATRDRATPLQRFQNEEVPVFLISLKAGGTGLNLTAADTVIHYDPWWNPAVEDQATDRAYRIGQDKPVFVYRLIVEDSVEEKMLGLQERKRALAESVYDSAGGMSYGFDESDLAELFS